MLLRSMKVYASAALVALGLSLPASPGHAQAGPFAGMAGSWSGVGLITPSSNDPSERIRCRVQYVLSDGGNALAQELLCAGDSYQFEVSSKLISRNNSISGTWSEATRKVSGNVTGDARSGTITVRVDGPGFTAALNLQTSGRIQTASLKPQGAGIASVTITLTRD